LEPASLDLSGILDGAALLEADAPGGPRLLLVQSGNSTTTMLLLWNWASFPDLCMAPLEIPHGMFEVGDLDGDGIDELALLSQWPDPPEVRLFAL
ncbi:hypothetical protein P6P38_14610, partial [Clostridium perfringens]|nr:hypothetical protein [Clostridium perfringens]